MLARRMTKAELLRRLRFLSRQAGSQEALARQCRVSPSYLSDVLRGRREPGDKLLRALGILRVVEYEEERHSA